MVVVDGVAQKYSGNIQLNRLHHGTTRRVSADTFLMDNCEPRTPSKEKQSGFSNKTI
jgi:hypothetical protein